MVTLGSLLLPIFLSAVLVFLTSSFVHMVLRYHATDYTRLPNEDAVRSALRATNAPPAQYIIPYASSMKEMETPAMKEKYREGPVAVLYLKRSGAYSMRSSLGQWFAFTLVVSLFVAYTAAHALPPGTRYLAVFRIVGSVAFLAYSFGQFPAAIWMGKPWAVAWKEALDGLLYALVTAGTFGWLWPR